MIGFRIYFKCLNNIGKHQQLWIGDYIVLESDHLNWVTLKDLNSNKVLKTICSRINLKPYNMPNTTRKGMQDLSYLYLEFMT